MRNQRLNRGKRYRVKAYKAGSRSASALAAALGGRVLLDKGSTFRAAKGDVVINWGSQAAEALSVFDRTVSYLNPVNLVAAAANKLSFFQRLSKVPACKEVIPQFWTRREDIPDEAFPIVCRTLLSSHSGRGIVIAATRSDLVAAPLYVQYVKKQDEYRVHLGTRDDESHVIAVQRKARDTRVENPNWQVRNHDNGFIFVRSGFTAPRAVIEAAEVCFMNIGLDFGAVDVIYNEKTGRAYVLEINTAPGLEGQTIEDYAAFFRGF